MLSFEDTSDNVLRIVIAFPMEGEEFEKSRLLDYYEDVLFDFDDREIKRNKRKHYDIHTENHILDVISNSEPSIWKIQIEQ